LKKERKGIDNKGKVSIIKIGTEAKGDFMTDFQTVTIRTESGKEIKRSAFAFLHGSECFAQIGKVLYKKMQGAENVYEFIGYSEGGKV